MLRGAGDEFFQRDLAVFVGVELGEAFFETGFGLGRIRSLFGAGQEFFLAQESVVIGIELFEILGGIVFFATRRFGGRGGVFSEDRLGEAERGASAEECGDFVFHIFGVTRGKPTQGREVAHLFSRVGREIARIGDERLPVGHGPA